MNDRFVERKTVGFGSRLKSAVGGVVVGLALFVGAFPLLVWNENRAVRAIDSLNEGEGMVVSVDSASVDSQQEGKLVHTFGQATTNAILTDDIFQVSAPAIKLKREVEMYQWKESSKTTKEKKLGGGEEQITEYTYNKVWSNKAIDSSNFKITKDHYNPNMPVESETWQAQDVSLGAYKLNRDLIGQIQEFEKLPVTNEDLQKLSADQQSQMQVSSGQLYWGKSTSSPQIGDMRIQYEVVKPLTVSVVAKQVANTFESYPTNAGDEILMLAVGTVSAKNMFAQAKQTAAMMTWIWRLVGLICMFMGISLFLKPISVFGDVVPFIGSLLGMGIGLVAILIALPLSLITIAIAWFAVRPVMSIIGIVLAVGIFVAIKTLAGKSKTRQLA